MSHFNLNVSVLEAHTGLAAYFAAEKDSPNSTHAVAAARQVLEILTGGALPSYAQRSRPGRKKQPRSAPLAVHSHDPRAAR